MKDFKLNPEKVFKLLIKLIEDQENIKVEYELKERRINDEQKESANKTGSGAA
mgnify:CR=1 FL=1